MPPTPRPAGWKGGSEDFGIVRTLDGHVANPNPPTDQAVDADYGRNERRGFESADLNGDYDTSYDA